MRLVENAGQQHWNFLIGAFVVVGLWETLRPFRQTVASTPRRWLANAALAVPLNLFSWLLVPFSAVLVSMSIPPGRWGLLNSPSVPVFLRVLIAILFIDLVRFLSHRAFHSIPALWRLHQVHHSDPDLDLTTALRFHPLEGFVAQAAQLAAIFLLAPPPIAVLISELVLAVQNFLSHANVAIPPVLESKLKLILITPHLHRAHHSVDVQSQNSNFGTVFSFWDRISGCYNNVPDAGDPDTPIGLGGVSIEKGHDLLYLLGMPFRRIPPE